MKGNSYYNLLDHSEINEIDEKKFQSFQEFYEKTKNVFLSKKKIKSQIEVALKNLFLTIIDDKIIYNKINCYCIFSFEKEDNHKKRNSLNFFNEEDDNFYILNFLQQFLTTLGYNVFQKKQDKKNFSSYGLFIQLNLIKKDLDSYVIKGKSLFDKNFFSFNKEDEKENLILIVESLYENYMMLKNLKTSHCLNENNAIDLSFVNFPTYKHLLFLKDNLIFAEENYRTKKQLCLIEKNISSACEQVSFQLDKSEKYNVFFYFKNLSMLNKKPINEKESFSYFISLLILFKHFDQDIKNEINNVLKNFFIDFLYETENKSMEIFSFSLKDVIPNNFKEKMIVCHFLVSFLNFLKFPCCFEKTLEKYCIYYNPCIKEGKDCFEITSRDLNYKISLVYKTILEENKFDFFNFPHYDFLFSFKKHSTFLNHQIKNLILEKFEEKEENLCEIKKIELIFSTFFKSFSILDFFKKSKHKKFKFSLDNVLKYSKHENLKNFKEQDLFINLLRKYFEKKLNNFKVNNKKLNLSFSKKDDIFYLHLKM